MSLSTAGTINTVTISFNDIVKDALQDLRVLLDGGTPTAGDVSDAQRKVNFLLKKWAIKGLLLWCRDTIPIPMVTNIFKYTIGPGGDVDTYRPLRALEGTFIRQTCGQQPAPDVPMTLLSRLDYERMSQKGITGVPNSFYYDPQMAPSPFTAYDPAVSKGILYVWTAPSDLTRTLFLEVQRPIQDITDPTQTFDLPLEWYETLSMNVASAVADKYEIPEDRIRRIKGEAAQSLEELADWGAQEQAPLRFEPDWRWNTGRGMR